MKNINCRLQVTGYRLLVVIICNLQLATFNSFAQQSKVDSLLSLVKTLNNPSTAVTLSGVEGHQPSTITRDTSLVNTLNALAEELIKTGDYVSGLIYANDAFELAAGLHFKKGMAKAKNNIGVIYYNQGNYPEALKEYFSSLKIREEIGDKKGIAASHINIGSIYYQQGNYPEALKEYFSALKTAEAVLTQSEAKGKNPSEKQSAQKQIANSHMGIGLIYYEQGNYPEALKEYFFALKTSEAVLSEAKNPSEKQSAQKQIANSHNNIGSIYYQQGSYPEALKEYFSSLKIVEEIGDKYGIAASHINIGSVYIKQNKAGEAHLPSLRFKEVERGKKEFETALKISREIGSKEGIKDSYSGLAETDSALGNYKAALENYKLYIIYRDSLINEENTKKSVQHQMQFEFDKKEAAAKAESDKQQAVAEAEKQRQRIVLILVSCVLLLVLVFAGFVFRALRITQKQKKLIEQQKRIVEEKQNEILASIRYAKRIQDAILPTEKYIDKTLKRLNP